MRMAPVYSPDGQLLGHLDVDNCQYNDNTVTVRQESPSLLRTNPFATTASEMVNLCRLPIRELLFKNESRQQYIMSIIADDLPNWFWDAQAAVKFSPDQWERL